MVVATGVFGQGFKTQSRGAVDLTLYQLDTGEPLDMGTAWDFFGAESNTFNATEFALTNRLRLRGCMEQVGFVAYDVEWWHFELPNATALPALDVPYVIE